jgi:hypothetical protein
VKVQKSRQKCQIWSVRLSHGMWDVSLCFETFALRNEDEYIIQQAWEFHANLRSC